MDSRYCDQSASFGQTGLYFFNQFGVLTSSCIGYWNQSRNDSNKIRSFKTMDGCIIAMSTTYLDSRFNLRFGAHTRPSSLSADPIIAPTTNTDCSPTYPDHKNQTLRPASPSLFQIPPTIDADARQTRSRCHLHQRLTFSELPTIAITASLLRSLNSTPRAAAH